MKVGSEKTKRVIFIFLLVLPCIAFLVYQTRIYVGETIWKLRNIDSYMIVVETQEEFGSVNKIETTCLYILAVHKEVIEIADISCENNTKQKLTYLGKDMTASGLINLAKKFQTNKSFINFTNKDSETAIDWRYGFPTKLVLENNGDEYRAIITVQDFKVYKKITNE